MFETSLVAENRCCICESDTTKVHGSFHDDRYGYPGNFKLILCKNCKHIFLLCNFSDEALSNLYTEYYPRSKLDIPDRRVAKTETVFSEWLEGTNYSPFRWVAQNATVLDIGCGFGESLDYLQGSGCDVYGVEADKNVNRLAVRYGNRIHVGLFHPQFYDHDFFDYITMGQVIEHVKDPLKTLQGMALIMKPQAIAILSTPNAHGWGAKLFGKYWIHWHTPYHLHFYSEKSMRKLADKAGLELISVKTITPSIWLHSQWLHLITFPSGDAPSAYWSPNSTWGTGETLLRKLLSVMHTLKFNHIVTRFFDAIGLGDNRMYFLRKP